MNEENFDRIISSKALLSDEEIEAIVKSAPLDDVCEDIMSNSYKDKGRSMISKAIPRGVFVAGVAVLGLVLGAGIFASQLGRGNGALDVADGSQVADISISQVSDNEAYRIRKAADAEFVALRVDNKFQISTEESTFEIEDPEKQFWTLNSLTLYAADTKFFYKHLGNESRIYNLDGQLVCSWSQENYLAPVDLIQTEQGLIRIDEDVTSLFRVLHAANDYSILENSQELDKVDGEQKPLLNLPPTDLERTRHNCQTGLASSADSLRTVSTKDGIASIKTTVDATGLELRSEQKSEPYSNNIWNDSNNLLLTDASAMSSFVDYELSPDGKVLVYRALVNDTEKILAKRVDTAETLWAKDNYRLAFATQNNMVLINPVDEGQGTVGADHLLIVETESGKEKERIEFAGHILDIH